ncbi:SIS domain-containing protein [Sphingosinicella sp. BN140058]|uniref:SIS domain-containing protein n=1 Tax=Sphingosinicella sp. BN140058 TaxID=1892855 RepID=UPI001FB19676|nr:SIS domain-containing protein [Sphingosinicella sp. BN140058]
MFAEAAEAGDAVARQLDENLAQRQRIGARLRSLAPQLVVTCARGSSDHAATFAKYLIETKTGATTASAAPSITSVYEGKPKLDGTLCIAVSQSGKSPDLLASVETARNAGAYVIVLVNQPDSPLAALAHEVLPLHAGPELSVAATKSYIASLAAITGLVAEWAQDDPLREALAGAPALLRQAWELDWSPLVDLLRDRTNLYTIGRGIALGVAQEAALKLKETCGLHAEAFSAAEVRHGPMAIVGKDFPILVFRQRDKTAVGVTELVAELAARGSRVAVAGEGPAGTIALPCVDSHPVLQPILQIQSFYRAANALSFARGFDPDRPPHLSKVTETI